VTHFLKQPSGRPVQEIINSKELSSQPIYLFVELKRMPSSVRCNCTPAVIDSQYTSPPQRLHVVPPGASVICVRLRCQSCGGRNKERRSQPEKYLEYEKKFGCAS